MISWKHFLVRENFSFFHTVKGLLSETVRWRPRHVWKRGKKAWSIFQCWSCERFHEKKIFLTFKKFMNFSAAQILREINYDDLISSKIAIFSWPKLISRKIRAACGNYGNLLSRKNIPWKIVRVKSCNFHTVWVLLYSRLFLWDPAVSKLSFLYRRQYSANILKLSTLFFSCGPL